MAWLALNRKHPTNQPLTQWQACSLEAAVQQQGPFFEGLVVISIDLLITVGGHEYGYRGERCTKPPVSWVAGYGPARKGNQGSSKQANAV